jgi:hypothetical protein
MRTFSLVRSWLSLDTSVKDISCLSLAYINCFFCGEFISIVNPRLDVVYIEARKWELAIGQINYVVWMCLKFRTEIGKTLEFNHEFTIKRELPKNQVSPLHIWYRLFTVHREHPAVQGSWLRRSAGTSSGTSAASCSPRLHCLNLEFLWNCSL